MLVIARKRGLIATVPEIDWLRAPPQEFDFLDFEEADRLLAAVDEEWRTMVLVALRTGMRMGELIALRRQDVDLVAGKVTVKQGEDPSRLISGRESDWLSGLFVRVSESSGVIRTARWCSVWTRRAV